MPIFGVPRRQFDELASDHYDLRCRLENVEYDARQLKNELEASHERVVTLTAALEEACKSDRASYADMHVRIARQRRRIADLEAHGESAEASMLSMLREIRDAVRETQHASVDAAAEVVRQAMQTRAAEGAADPAKAVGQMPTWEHPRPDESLLEWARRMALEMSLGTRPAKPTAYSGLPPKLHVAFFPDDTLAGNWFGQGKEFDYGAFGFTLEAAKQDYASGLRMTLDIRAVVGIPMDNVTPDEDWQAAVIHPEMQLFVLDTVTWAWSDRLNT